MTLQILYTANLDSANTSTLGTEFFRLVQNGVSRKANLKDYIPQHAFANVSVANSTNISNASITTIKVLGYASPGDGGEAVYSKANSEPSHPGKIQTADGAWWEIVNDVVRPEMYGVVTGDGTTSDHTALFNMTEHGRARGYLRCELDGSKTYVHENPRMFAGITHLHIEGNGASWRNISGANGGYDADGAALTFPTIFFKHGTASRATAVPLGENDFGQLIETASAAASTVTVQAGEGTPNFSIGDRVLIYGFARYSSSGFPPAPRNFEWREVFNISGQVVTLDKPLTFSYDADWPEDTANNIYSKPRIIGTNRGTSVFKEIDSLIIRNLNLLTDPDWVPVTSNANGRLDISGVRYAVIENVSVPGITFPNTSETIIFRGCQFTDMVECDKIVDNLIFDQCKGESIAQGIATRSIYFKGSTFTNPSDLQPINTLSFDGGLYHQASSASQEVIRVPSVKNLIVTNGARFLVDKSGTKGLIDVNAKSLTIGTVVDANTFKVTSADFRSSGIAEDIGPNDNSILLDAYGRPACRIKRIYETGSETFFDADFYKVLANSDVLYTRRFDTFDFRGGIFEGPYAHLAKHWATQFTAAPTTWASRPASMQVYGPNIRPGWLRVDSEDLPSAISTTPMRFSMGRPFVPSRLIVHVYKAYTGVSANAEINVTGRGSATTWARIDLKTTGRRVVDVVSGAHGSAGTDILATTLDMEATQKLAKDISINAVSSFTVADEGEAARWSVELEAMPF